MKFRFSRKQLCIPYAAFLICFVIAPLLVVIYYAFTNGEGRFTLTNFTNFLQARILSEHSATVWLLQ